MILQYLESLGLKINNFPSLGQSTITFDEVTVCFVGGIANIGIESDGFAINGNAIARFVKNRQLSYSQAGRILAACYDYCNLSPAEREELLGGKEHEPINY